MTESHKTKNLYFLVLQKEEVSFFFRKFIEKINNRNSQNDGKNFKYFITEGWGEREG